MESQTPIIDEAGLKRLLAIEAKMKHEIELKNARNERYRKNHPACKETMRLYKREYDRKKREAKAAAAAAAN